MGPGRDPGLHILWAPVFDFPLPAPAPKHRQSGESQSGGGKPGPSQWPGWGLLPGSVSPHRHKGNAGVAQDEVYPACEGHSCWEWRTPGRGLPRVEAMPQCPPCLPSSGRGVSAPLGTVQRYGLPAGPDQRGAAGPWQPPRASPGGAGGLCPVTTGALCNAQHPRPVLNLAIQVYKAMHACWKNATMPRVGANAIREAKLRPSWVFN